MEKTPLFYDDSIIKSRLSLKLLVDLLRKTVAEGKAGSQKLYGGLLGAI